MIGKKYTEISTGIFGFEVGKHIVFYRELNAETVEIIRVLQRMDLKNRLD